MVYSYPTKITGSTGRSTKYNTQNISNPNALCSNSKTLAYWGVKNPTYVGNYLRNWYDSVTTASGSYHTPEVIYASGFTVPNAPKEAHVTSIKLEYKWEQVSYSCGTMDCFGRFGKPKISLMKNGKTLQTKEGAKPEAIRYHNNKTNPAKMNVNSAELATLHSITFNVPKGLTIKDLHDKIKIKFAPAKNTYSEYVRIIMQFLRLKITYKDIDPTFRVSSTISHTSIQTQKEYTYKVTIASSNGRTNTSHCTVNFSDKNTQIISAKTTTGSGSYSNGKWTIKKYNNNKAILTIKCKNAIAGKKTITTTIDQNGFPDSTHRSTTQNIQIVAPPSTEGNVSFSFNTNRQEPLIFKTIHSNDIKLYVTLKRDFVTTAANESIEIDTDGLITEDIGWANQDINIQYKNDGKWLINNIKTKEINLISNNVILNEANEYNCIAKHIETNKPNIERKFKITVLGHPLEKEYFKLRVEDGSDIRYNSLMFSQGDDLTIPLTYNTIDLSNLTADNIIVNGETKRISTGEAKFLNFNIDIQSSTDTYYENTICFIEAYNTDGELCNDIIVGGGNGIDIIDGDTNKYCIIDKLYTKQSNHVPLIVQSDIEQICYIKLMPLNYDRFDDDNTWSMGKAYFQDIPNIKIYIQGTSDLTYTNDTDNIFSLYYYIENQSDVDATNIKFKIKEPNYFKKMNFVKIVGDIERTVKHDLTDENITDTSPWFNDNNRVITFPILQAHSKPYKLRLDYQATKKGIYDFIIQTLDYTDTIEDDQHQNKYTHKLLVNIDSQIEVKTTVSKQNPFLQELFDFNIYVKNHFKHQDKITFTVKDIGEFDTIHNTNDYNIEFTEYDNGIFTKNNENNNIIGTWEIYDVNPNDEYMLTISMRPQDIGTHVIYTECKDSKQQTQHYENIVKVLEPNHDIDFNVEHAVHNNNEIDCNIDNLTVICDDDFISMNDIIYYIVTITNNSNENINNTYVYARLPNTFIENGILCTSQAYISTIDEDTGLISTYIQKILRGETIQYVFAVQPNTRGEYKEHFTLTTRNAHILHKHLQLTVDTHFNPKQLEHEINIYNFEKTHQYYRYEIDATGEIFKYYNKGDISKRTLDIEPHKYSALETYKGTNLKQLIKDIKENSKYVEPEFLRIGTNHLNAQAYELYPDGFIRRFGLLNSEIYHHTGQLPQINNFVDYAMKWDIDKWDTKLWAGDKYTHGVFGVSVDYDKIPRNFNILDIDDPINKLQSLVEKTKPFGTKAICYYNNTIEFNLKMVAQLQHAQVQNTMNLPLDIDDKFGLVSLYNRHDNSIAAYYDLTYHDIELNDIAIKEFSDIDVNNDSDDIAIMETDIDYTTTIYNEKYQKIYARDCLEIFNNFNTPSTIYNINISKDNNFDISLSNITNQTLDILQNEYLYTLYCNDDIQEDDNVGFKINNIKVIRYKDAYSNGFKITDNNTTLYQMLLDDDIDEFTIQLQCLQLQNTQNNIQNVSAWIDTGNGKLACLGAFYVDNLNTTLEYYTNKNHQAQYGTFSTLETIVDDEDTIEINHDNPLIFSINNNIKMQTEKHDSIYSTKWANLNKINNKGYALIENTNNKKMKIPPLYLKYNNIDIDRYDEVQDIQFKIKSHHQKPNFKEDTQITLHKDGDSYVPDDNISRKIYYPTQISNVNQEFISTFTINQPNITICSNCLKTTLGYYDNCPYCNSDAVSHYAEKVPVTICDACGYIANDWHDYCIQCLSYDVEKVLVDFNKTYCQECHTMHNDYYTVCPKCLSSDVIHLQNDEKSYQIFDNTTVNIEPIVAQTHNNRVNMCNITVPLSQDMAQLRQLDSLLLEIDVTNNNDGKYYYCPECEIVGVGHYTQCPHCDAHTIKNFTDSNISFDIYLEMNNKIMPLDINNTLPYGQTTFEIDILDLAMQNQNNNFTLKIYTENLNQESLKNSIHQLHSEDKYINDTLDKINKLDVTINNMSLKSKYIDENEWIGLDNIFGINHSGIKYIMNNEQETALIRFSNFDIDENRLEHLFLHINGINKTFAHVDMDIKIIDENNNLYTTTIHGVNNDLFAIEQDIHELTNTHKALGNLSVEISFTNIKNNHEIIITDCYIVTEKQQYDNIEINNTTKNNIQITQKNNIYHIKNQDSNLWKLNETAPYYLSGNQLETNLLCVIDFGTLQPHEYIRIYDIEMIITYKNKYGYFITDTIPITDDMLTEQLISGDIQKNQAENWGTIKVPNSTLNNLEYDININSNDEKILDSVPLCNMLAQSFIAPTNNIYRIQLEYFGKYGYPSESIDIGVYDDENGQPGNPIYTRTIHMPLLKSTIDIDFYAETLIQGDTYWLVLTDNTADDNNYHRFRFNYNNANNILRINNHYDENIALSFAIDINSDIAEYQELPTSWTLDTNINSDFKLHNSLYRFNTQSNSNVYIKNLFIKSGYIYGTDINEDIIDDELDINTPTDITIEEEEEDEN